MPRAKAKPRPDEREQRERRPWVRPNHEVATDESAFFEEPKPVDKYVGLPKCLVTDDGTSGAIYDQETTRRLLHVHGLTVPAGRNVAKVFFRDSMVSGIMFH